MEYEIIRSRRKTFSLQVTPKGLIVRAPLRATDGQIADVVARHGAWIEKQEKRIAAAEQNLTDLGLLSEEEIRGLAAEALRVIPARVAHYAPLVGVSYGRVTIRNQRSRWGSCSSQGNLNFNCLLMLAPPEVLDSVVVHELCHRKEPNHSKRFYAEVLRVFPNYRACEKWLKDNGPGLLRRMTG